MRRTPRCASPRAISSRRATRRSSAESGPNAEISRLDGRLLELMALKMPAAQSGGDRGEDDAGHPRERGDDEHSLRNLGFAEMFGREHRQQEAADNWARNRAQPAHASRPA